MKKWTGLVVSVVVVILIAYYLMGFIVERTLSKNVNSIPESPMLSVHLDKYQRGWFSSQAQLAMTMHIPEQVSTDKNGVIKRDPAVNFDLDFPLIINHGPIIFTDYGIRFGIGQATTNPQTHFNVLVNYFNETLFKYDLPSFTLNGNIGPNGENVQFEWQGLSALLGISPNVDKLEGAFILYGLKGSADNAVFKFGKISNEVKLHRVKDWLWLGQTHFSVPSVLINLENKKAFELEAFNLALDSHISGEALNFDCNISLQKLFVDNETYGPSTLKLSVRNLDSDAMAQISQQQSAMLQNNQDPNLFTLALLTELPKLLSKGSELELSEMTFNLPEGKITGNLKITLPKTEPNDLAQLMQKAQGNGQFKAPIAIVKEFMAMSIEGDLRKKAEKTAQTQPSPEESAITATLAPTTTPAPTETNFEAESQKQADKILQELVTKGLLKVEGNNYVLIFKVENQQFIVNGQPFSPDMLK